MTLVAGDLCVDTSAAWTDVTVYDVVEGESSALFLQPSLRNGMPTGGGPRFQIPASITQFYALPKLDQGLTKELIQYRRITTKAEMILHAAKTAATPKMVKVTALIAEVHKTLKLPLADVEGVIRLRVGQGAYVVKAATPSPEIGLASISRIMEKSRQYVGDLAAELRIQSERIGNLIEHGSTVGSYREDLVRNLLKRHLPERYHVATGFVYGSARQADILIYDRLDYAALFREGDLVVAQPESVRAIIEVKSDLDPKNIAGSLNLLQEICPANIGGPPVFLGVMAYDGPKKAKTLAKHIRAYYRGELRVERKDPPLPEEQWIGHFDDLATAVCILDRTLITGGFAVAEGSPCLRPHLYEMKSVVGRDAYAAMFINLLMDHLRYPIEAERQDHFISMMMLIEQDAGEALAIEDHCDWGPYAGPNHDATERLERFVRAVRAWRLGYGWSL